MTTSPATPADTIAPDPSQTLGDLVTTHPGAAPVFERLGIDYCCHGARPLHDAATAVGLDPREVLRHVLAADAVGDADHPVNVGAYAHLGAAELADHIEATHHVYLHAELPRLVALTAKIADVHGDRHPELHQVAAATRELHDDLEPHMGKEEQILFPMIRRLAEPGGDEVASFCGSVEHPVARMMLEHEATGEILARLRALTRDYDVPADGCASYEAAYRGLEALELDTHAHIHKENNVLFPKALALTADPAS